MNIQKLSFLPGLILCCLLMGISAQETSCPIHPHPISYQPTGQEIPFPDNSAGAIVIANDAHETIRYAAERFRLSLERMVHRSYPIVSEIPPEATLVFMLGVPDQDLRLKTWCISQELDITSESWGDDGFLIHSLTEGTRTTVGVAAEIPRGVIYGQEALTWLFAGKKTLTVAGVRDHAKIKWRSFAWDRVSLYTEERLDLYADARINCIELRDGSSKPVPGFSQGAFGMFGYPADVTIDGIQESRVIREAHRRGMFVWGVVCCGVAEEHHDQVIAQFNRLADLGVDGLYISYDDPGAADGAPKLVARILQLAHSRGFDMDHIAFLPPAPDYGHIYEDFDLQMVAEVPEITKVRWFLTTPLSNTRKEVLADLGITRKTGFWFNWPMGGKPAWRGVGIDNAYRPLPDFSDGYGTGDAMIDGCDQGIDAVMVWVRAYEEYLAQLICAAFWNPDAFSRKEAWARVYGYAYGPAMVSTAIAFDERMTWLKEQFRTVGPWDWAQHIWGLSSSQRTLPRKLLADLQRLHAELSTSAPAGTWLSSTQLENRLLNPMNNTLEWMKLLVETEFPEQFYANFDRDLKWETEVKNNRDGFLNFWAPQIEECLKGVEAALGDRCPYTKTYLEEWRKKLEITPHHTKTP